MRSNRPSVRRSVGPSIRQSIAGFSLLEAVVAVMIVGLASVSALAAFGAQFRAAARVRNALEAEALAQERLSAIVVTPSIAFPSLPDSLRSGEFPPPFNRYHWEATARSVRNEAALFDITATVLWVGGSYRLDSRLYRPVSVVPRK
jgi:type II secretory pathway pseudopilin PulG